MKLRVKINQSGCLVRGLDAVNSIHDMEINPATIPADIRRWLSVNLSDGINANLQFNVPKPNQADLVEIVRGKLDQEASAQRALLLNQQAFEQALTELDRKMSKGGNLSPLSILQATVSIVQPALDEIVKIPVPKGYQVIGFKLHIVGNLTKPDQPANLSQPLLITHQSKVSIVDDSDKQDSSGWRFLQFQSLLQRCPVSLQPYALTIAALPLLTIIETLDTQTGSVFLQLKIRLPGVPPDVAIWLRLDQELSTKSQK